MGSLTNILSLIIMNRNPNQFSMSWILLLSIHFVFSGCFSDTSYADFKHFREKNMDGLVKESGNELIKVSIEYIPSDLVALRNYDEEMSNKVPFDEFKKNYEEYINFEMKIYSSKNSSSIHNIIKNHEESERINNYYNYFINQDVKLIFNSDTLPCNIIHQVQGGGIYDYLSFTCAFEGIDILSNPKLSFLYHDQIFSDQTFIFPFNSEKLNEVPKIKK